MKISIAELVEYYRGLYPTLNFRAEDRAYLKTYFQNLFSNYANSISTSTKNYNMLYRVPDLHEYGDPNYLKLMSQLKKEFKDRCKKGLPKEITDIDIKRSFGKSFLNESLTCLDRSIYWFLNYKRNMDEFSLNSKIQNLYYSEFFIHLSIARFIGLSYTWIKEFGSPIKLQFIKINDLSSNTFEEKIKIESSFNVKGGMHQTIFIQIRYHIEQNVDLLKSVVSEWLEPTYMTSLIQNERENFVYDISRSVNNPWHNAHRALSEEYRNWCFLDGGNRYLNGIEENDTYIHEKFGNWGYREAHVGNLIKWMFERLKEIGAIRKINQMKRLINGFDEGYYPDSVNEAKLILLSWL